ncbi:BMP family ABC transporter substrate-binding protein [Marinobacterium rhizophilum]|uniref:BMP family ABC transporter substrate-binding protein n=1 Tax=Marinobacterium rhizophilum TaxID=420402 RepID=UPI000378BCC7|nr:BMP family ABC transporter substrate-binding protein [Marinobacterium rhizophilum]
MAMQLGTLVRTVSALVLAAMVSGAALAKEPLKVGFVYIGPTGDAGYTYAHDKGRKYMEEKLGDQVTSTYVENVAEGADSERVIRQLAKSGHELIFTTSFGYMNPTLKVAKQFPKVAFEHATGYKRAANVGTYMGRIYESRYLTGVIAGKMTKSNVVGYVGSFPIPEVVRGINAFTRGLRSVNPEATVKVVWVSSWYDPAKELEAAESLILQGADVISQHTDSAGPIQAAEAKGVYAFGHNSDMSLYGKKAHLSASVFNWGPLYEAKARAVIDGSWKAEDVWLGLSAGYVDIAPMSDAVPADVQSLVIDLKQQIVDGTLHPFAGPVKNQAGDLVAAEGEVLSDKELLSMGYYVEGVEGELPK